MIRLELRCQHERRCLMAVIRQDGARGLVADVRTRDAVAGDGMGFRTQKRTVPIGDRLLLSCRHEQGVVLFEETVQAYIRDTPKGVRIVV